MFAHRLVLLAAVALAAGCGDDASEPRPVSASKPRPVAGLPGRIVDIGGRYLYYECAGRGSPTILLEAGFTGTTTDSARRAAATGADNQDVQLRPGRARREPRDTR